MKIVDGLMTPVEAAKRLRIKSRAVIYAAIKPGRRIGDQVIKLRTVLVFGKIRIHATDLDAFIAECNAAAGNTASRVLRLIGNGRVEEPVEMVGEPAYPTSGRGKGRKGGAVGAVGAHRSETCATVGTEAFDGRRGRRE